jgi:hypothetical protein
MFTDEKGGLRRERKLLEVTGLARPNLGSLTTALLEK